MFTVKIPSKASLLFQAVIWIVLFVVFSILNAFAFEEPFTKTYSASIFNMMMNILLVNVHLYVLIPSFFKTKTIHKYVLSLIGVIVLLSLLKALSIYQVKPIEVEETFFESRGPKIAFTTSFMILIITLPLLLFDILIRKEVEKAHLKTKALETELQFLKMQVNPHFLFNVLNNVYSMIFIQNKNAGPTVLKLSGMMRYMLYDASEEKVLLQKEVDYLQEYIDLQTLKQREKSTVELLVGEFPKNLKIEPFLLIPFLENAFKHGNWDAEGGQGWIRVKILFESGILVFDFANSVSPLKEERSIHGIGLKNVQQRLHLFYPERHQLKIEQNQESYHVHLQLQFHKTNDP